MIGPDAGVHGEFAFILSAARLTDGSIAVVSRGTQDIRIFDARGRHARTYGRKGADRKPRARVVLPPNLRPYEIGRDYVLGVTTDEDGVESVVLHRYAR